MAKHIGFIDNDKTLVVKSKVHGGLSFKVIQHNGGPKIEIHLTPDERTSLLKFLTAN